MPVPTANALRRALRVSVSSTATALPFTSTRCFSISSPTRGVPIQQVFRIAARNRDFEAALDRLQYHYDHGKLDQKQGVLIWTAIAERWPIREAAPILLDPEEHYIVAPEHTVEFARDIARRTLVNPDKPNPPLGLINTVRPVLDMYAPNDPFTLLLLLTAYAQLPPTKDGQAARLTAELQEQILPFVRAADKWAPFSADALPPKAGDEDWGLIRPSVSEREADGNEYLSLRTQDSKATVKALDILLGLFQEGKLDLELDLLEWYADRPTPCTPRFHRTRLHNYLQAITNPVVPIISLGTEPMRSASPPNLSLPLLNVFLRPALVHHSRDPIVNLFVLRALHLFASTPSSPSSDVDKAKAVIEERLSQLEAQNRRWNSTEYRETLRLGKGDGARVRQNYAIASLNLLVKDKVLSVEQAKMWDVVFDNGPVETVKGKKAGAAEGEAGKAGEESEFFFSA